MITLGLSTSAYLKSSQSTSTGTDVGLAGVRGQINRLGGELALPEPTAAAESPAAGLANSGASDLPPAPVTNSGLAEPRPTEQVSDVQAVNGVTVEASNFRTEGKELLAKFCYPLMSSYPDWVVARPELRLGETTILADSVLNDDPADGERCATAYFPMPDSPDLRAFQVTIAQLQTSMAEHPDCALVQQRLAAEQTGIEIQCHEGDGYFAGVTVLKSPASMTSQEVDQAVMNAFVERVPGPWLFTGSLNMP